MLPEGRKITQLAMNTPAIYEICVGGKLGDQWAQWFNGTLNEIQEISGSKPQTCLTYKVRDQAELLGVLKQLNALNLPLIGVCLLSPDRSTEGE
jgi:hypothetical protein